MKSQSAEESSPETIQEAEAMIKKYEEELTSLQEAYKNLLASEDPSKGIFHHAEIHENRQRKNVAEVNRQIAQNALKRIQFSDGF